MRQSLLEHGRLLFLGGALADRLGLCQPVPNDPKTKRHTSGDDNLATLTEHKSTKQPKQSSFVRSFVRSYSSAYSYLYVPHSWKWAARRPTAKSRLAGTPAMAWAARFPKLATMTTIQHFFDRRRRRHSTRLLLLAPW